MSQLIKTKYFPEYHLGEITQLKDKELALSKIEKRLEVKEGWKGMPQIEGLPILNIAFRHFMAGTYVPHWNFSEGMIPTTPQVGDRIVVESQERGLKYPVIFWGFYNQFQKVVQEMSGLPLYRLHIQTQEGWKNEAWKGRRTNELARLASLVPAQYRGSPIILERLEGNTWIRQPERFFFQLLMFDLGVIDFERTLFGLVASGVASAVRRH